MIWEKLNENLIALNLEAESSDDIFEELGGRLIREGYCKESYIEALKERERNYPTGIDLQGINFAMPHTDRNHVNKTGFAIGVLNKPVHFYHMGTNDQDVMVSLVIMLAVENPEAHLAVLDRLISLFNQQEIRNSLMTAQKPLDIIQLFKNKEKQLDNQLS